MTDVDSDDDAINISNIAALVTITVGSLFSVILILILYRRKDSWNQFNSFIFYISVCDTIFFLAFSSYPLGIFFGGTAKFVLVLQIIELLFGNLSYCFSALMSFTVSYLLFYGKIIDIFQHKVKVAVFFAVILATWFPLAIYSMSFSESHIDQLHYDSYLKSFKIFIYCQVFLCTLNLVFYLSNVYRIRQMGIGSKSKFNSGSSSSSERAIVNLVKRLKYYPLLQICARVFPTWLTFFSDFINRRKSIGSPGSYESFYFVIYILHDLGLLITPIGFLFVYLRLKKMTYSEFFQLFFPGLFKAENKNISKNAGNANTSDNTLGSRSVELTVSVEDTIVDPSTFEHDFPVDMLGTDSIAPIDRPSGFDEERWSGDSTRSTTSGRLGAFNFESNFRSTTAIATEGLSTTPSSTSTRIKSLPVQKQSTAPPLVQVSRSILSLSQSSEEDLDKIDEDDLVLYVLLTSNLANNLDK